jgi:hypothetical protein
MSKNIKQIKQEKQQKKKEAEEKKRNRKLFVISVTENEDKKAIDLHDYMIRTNKDKFIDRSHRIIHLIKQDIIDNKDLFKKHDELMRDLQIFTSVKKSE